MDGGPPTGMFGTPVVGGRPGPGAAFAVVGGVVGGAVVGGLVAGGAVVVVVVAGAVVGGAVVVGSTVIEEPLAGVVGPSAGRVVPAHATAPGTLGTASRAATATTDAAARRDRRARWAFNFNL
ncbi:MAG: hypothetical protein ACRDYY_18755 [Acidimicrobiales bacterium]